MSIFRKYTVLFENCVDFLKIVYIFENSSQLAFDVISKHTVFSNEIDIFQTFVFFQTVCVFFPKNPVSDPIVLEKHNTFENVGIFENIHGSN